MDVQSESNEPPACEPPPPSRINKAAFKLFGRRKPGSAVPAIFSMRGKGEGSKAAAKAPLVRSKTHDGLAEGGRGEQGAPEEPTEAPCEAAPPPPPPSRPSISSVASVKSLSFLTLLRGGSRRGGSASRRGGLRGLLGNVRWPRRARGPEDRRDEAPPPSDVLLASRSNSVEIVKEHMTLTPRPPPRTLDTTPTDSGMPSEGQGKSSLQSARPLSMATSPGSPPAVPSMDLLSSVLADISSLGSFDSPAASGDIASDAKTQVLRAGTSTEQDRGQGEAALLEKATLKATSVPVSDPQLILTPGSSSTSPKTPASTSAAATAPSILTAASIPSLSLKTSSTPTSTIPFVPTSKSAPIKATPIPTPTITSIPKTSPVPTPTITSAPKTTPVPTPTITSAPKITPISIAPAPTTIHNITHPMAIKPAPYPVSTIAALQTPTTVISCISKFTTVTTSTPTMTSLHVLNPVPVTTCTSASTPTSTTTSTPVSRPVPVLSASSTVTSTSEQKPCPSHSTTSPPTPDLTPIPTITSASKPITSSVYTVGPTPVTTSDPMLTPIPTIAPTPKLAPTLAITSTPVPTASPVTTIPLVPATTSATSPASAPKTFFAPDSTTVTRPADAPTPGEEAHSSTDEVSEDGEAGSCKLDLQKYFHSPSLAQSPLPEAGPALRPEKKLPPVSKIPVSGSGRPGKTPRDAVPDKGHLDLGTPIATPSSTPAATPVVTPAVTPGPEDECAGFTAQWNSSRGDVHHPNVDPAEVLEMSSRLTPPIRAPGAARTTRIPVKQTQLVHSTRQGAPIQPYPPQAKTEAPRTKIPVSKVPVRRGSNKPPTTHPSPHDLARK